MLPSRASLPAQLCCPARPMPPKATLSPAPAVTRNPPPNKTNSRTKRSCAWPTGPTIWRDSVSPFLNVRRLIFKAASGPTPHRAPGPGPLLLSPPVPPGRSLARAEALSPAHEEGPRVTLLAAGPPKGGHRAWGREAAHRDCHRQGSGQEPSVSRAASGDSGKEGPWR